MSKWTVITEEDKYGERYKLERTEALLTELESGDNV